MNKIKINKAFNIGWSNLKSSSWVKAPWGNLTTWKELNLFKTQYKQCARQVFTVKLKHITLRGWHLSIWWRWQNIPTGIIDFKLKDPKTAGHLFGAFLLIFQTVFQPLCRSKSQTSLVKSGNETKLKNVYDLHFLIFSKRNGN